MTVFVSWLMEGVGHGILATFMYIVNGTFVSKQYVKILRQITHDLRMTKCIDIQFKSLKVMVLLFLIRVSAIIKVKLHGAFYAIFVPADPIFALNFAGTFLITNIAMDMFQNGFLTKCQAAFEVRPLLFSCLLLLLFFFSCLGEGGRSQASGLNRVILSF